MNSNLFIPKKCKVGFNLRGDTYSGKLGYVIAWDGKKWRKENSWERWRQVKGKEKPAIYNHETRTQESQGVYGDEVEPIEFENNPISGFVLNKKVGGYKSEWNVRNTYARVYDPRGFEFEINIANLLYILEHSNCMRGKGLEGDFIYAWDGKDLVLLPSESPECKSALEYTKRSIKKISAKELAPGLIFVDKIGLRYVYLGRFEWFETNKELVRCSEKKHIFYRLDKKHQWSNLDFVATNSLSFIKEKVSDDIYTKFSSLIDKLKDDKRTNDLVSFRIEPKSFSGLEQRTLTFSRDGDVINEIEINKNYPHKYQKPDDYCTVWTKSTFNFLEKKQYMHSIYSYDYEYHSLDYVKNLYAGDLYITFANGKEIKIDDLYDL